MKTILIAALVAALMIGTSATTVAVVVLKERTASTADNAQAGADERMLQGGMAGDPAHDQVGMDRPRFAPETGTVPSASDANKLEEVSSLAIRADSEFDPSEGVRGGTGTLADPYVISGYYVTGDLYLADTDACFIVKENYIAGQLTLNWNGQCVYVHHNYIDDLRVNENVERTGYATGGLIEQNKIGFVGQLRHYDGEFRDNVVGPRVTTDLFDEILETVPWIFGEDPRIANIDGFNQGLIHHNTFYGSVDLDLHGHHHGTGFFAPHSHYHAMDANRTPEHAEDHTDRWTSVAFNDNKIIDEKGYGLRYDDENHAGDDRTANSEDNEMLDEEHKHHTLIEIARNVVEGSQIYIDVFNADDENHYTRNDGWLTIRDNTVTLKQRDDGFFGLGLFYGDQLWATSGILVVTAKEVETEIIGNKLTFVPLPDDQQSGPLGLPIPRLFEQDVDPAAIQLYGVKDALLTITDNQASGFYYGVKAQEMDKATQWSVLSNAFDAQYPVWYDESVANPPSGDDPGTQDGSHVHDG